MTSLLRRLDESTRDANEPTRLFPDAAERMLRDAGYTCSRPNPGAVVDVIRVGGADGRTCAILPVRSDGVLVRHVLPLLQGGRHG